MAHLASRRLRILIECRRPVFASNALMALSRNSARRILGIFRSHQLRAGQTLMRDQVRKEHLSDGRWQMRDFLAGLQYAIEREWIATPSPNVLRITERGVVAQEH